MEKTSHFCYSTWNNKKLRRKIGNNTFVRNPLTIPKLFFIFVLAILVIDFYTFEVRKVKVFMRVKKHKCIYIYIYMFMYVNASIQICGNGQKQ